MTFDTTIVHAFQANHTFLADVVGAAESRKYAKYLDAYGRQGAAFVPLASSSIGELGADLLRLLWICAAMAVHAAEVRDEGGAVPEAAHGPRPGPLDWKTRRGLLFQSMKNRYLVATYEAVVHRILGRYMGLRRDPKSCLPWMLFGRPGRQSLLLSSWRRVGWWQMVLQQSGGSLLPVLLGDIVSS